MRTPKVMDRGALSSGPKISLRVITAKNVMLICSLSVSEGQRRFVAPNAVSIAQAYFSKSAWFRAVYLDEAPIGFVMLAETPKRGRHFLWRFMIDVNYQGKGYGATALGLVINHVKRNPKAKALYLSVRREPGSAEGFYRRFGFEFNGKKVDDEHVMKLDLSRPRSR